MAFAILLGDLNADLATKILLSLPGKVNRRMKMKNLPGKMNHWVKVKLFATLF